MKTKQVLVLRRDINLKKGKDIAQGSHAAVSAFVSAFTIQDNEDEIVLSCKGDPAKFLRQWLFTTYTKVTLEVNSEEELQEVYKQAKEMDLPCSFITDNGLTQYNGVKTNTAVGIGPASSELIDQITGNLSLYSK